MARLALLAAAALLAGAARGAEPPITPRPAVVATPPGAAWRLAGPVPVVAPTGDRGAGEAAAWLADLQRRGGGVRFVLGQTRPAGSLIRFIRRPGIVAEGYRLDIDANGATIAAADDAGLLHGAASLWQVIAAAAGPVAPLHVEDAPRFRWRGLLLDSVRHRQSVAAIERIVDWMALHKLNRLQWHLADDQGWRLPVPGLPRLASVAAWRDVPPAAGLAPGRYGGVYSAAEIRRVVALAARRGVTVVPEIEMPGHATAAVLAYPAVGFTTLSRANLGDWGVFPSIYGVDDASFAFLHRVLDATMALFPGHEIAIGGDEAVHTLWHRSPAVQARMAALGLKDEDALQDWFVGRIGAYLAAHGRRLVGWDEILADPGLAGDDIVLSWHGADGAIAAARAGHDVVMATAPTLYLDNRQAGGAGGPPGRGAVVGLRDIYGFDPADPPRAAGTPPLDDAARAHVIGVQAQLWSEHLPGDAAVAAAALPRAAALAEIGWTMAARRDLADFEARLPALWARYAQLGLGADDGAVAVEAAVTVRGPRASVALRRQLDIGAIRYTLDGSAPTPASPAYVAPLDVPLAGRLRAASFAGEQRLSHELDQPLDPVGATRRASQQLGGCTNKVTLALAGRAQAAGAAGPTYLVDILHPCWIYRDADLGGVGHVAVTVAALPFNYQFANDAAPPVVPDPAAPTPTLMVRRGCDGPVLASMPLGPAPRDGREGEVVAAIPPQAGRGDLCLTLPRPTPDPLWAIGRVELRP